MNFLRKVKQAMQPDDEATTAEEIIVEPAQDDIMLTLQLRVPRAAMQTLEPVRGFLTGQLLVATPLITSGIFAKSVVYVFEHTAHGAAGLVINKPIETVSYDTLFRGQNLDLPRDNTLRQLPVFDGGPCDRHRGFILHSTDYKRTIGIAQHEGIAVTTSTTIVNDMAEGEGPGRASLIIGCAVWDGGQIEDEIAQNAWVTAAASPDLLFDTDPSLRWTLASQSLGIRDMAFYSTAVGHA